MAPPRVTVWDAVVRALHWALAALVAIDLIRDDGDYRHRLIGYAAADVLHLDALKAKLDALLAREGRSEFALRAFQFLPTRARLDLAGWPEIDIFEH